MGGAGVSISSAGQHPYAFNIEGKPQAVFGGGRSRGADAGRTVTEIIGETLLWSVNDDFGRLVPPIGGI